MEGKETATSVLMLPWLAHGHISPFLELAKKLADRNFHTYLCSTPILLQSIKNKVTQKYANSIELLPFHIPPSPELPLHNHTTNGLPPHLMVVLKNEYEKASPQFSTLLTKIHPGLVIYDFNQPWAAEMAVSRNIPAVQFNLSAACVTGFFWFMMHRPQTQFPCPEIYHRGYDKRKKQGDQSFDVETLKDLKRIDGAVRNSCSILLVKSCREIEDKYIDILEKLWEKKVVPVGQLIEDSSSSDEEEDQSEIIQFLEKKEKSSVLFVCFGSEYFLKKEERYEIAKGLELSDVNCIWVIRFSAEEKITIDEAFPDGFLEKIKGRGMIVEGWAPQKRILKHSNVGGFLTHCGWNSVNESMKFGVPIIALPMHSDQPLNARLVEALGVGVEVIRNEEEKLQSKEIAKLIRKVVVDESGEEVRKKMKKLSEQLKKKGDEDINTLVEEINKLCHNFNKKLSAGI